MGAFCKKSRQHKGHRSHAPVVLVEDKEKGHYGIGGPGDHKSQADAKKHLKKDMKHT